MALYCNINACVLQTFYIIAFYILKPLQISILKYVMHLTPGENISVLSDQRHGEGTAAQKYDTCESQGPSVCNSDPTSRRISQGHWTKTICSNRFSKLLTGIWTKIPYLWEMYGLFISAGSLRKYIGNKLWKSSVVSFFTVQCLNI